MEKEIDLNKLWQIPSPQGSDRITTIRFKEGDQRDLIMRIKGREIRRGPLRAAIIDNSRSRYVFIFESLQDTSKRSKVKIPTNVVNELLFWPRGQKAL